MIQSQGNPTVQRLENSINDCVKYIIGQDNEDRYKLAILDGDIQMYAVYDDHGGKFCELS